MPAAEENLQRQRTQKSALLLNDVLENASIITVYTPRRRRILVNNDEGGHGSGSGACKYLASTLVAAKGNNGT